MSMIVKAKPSKTLSTAMQSAVWLAWNAEGDDDNNDDDDKDYDDDVDDDDDDDNNNDDDDDDDDVYHDDEDKSYPIYLSRTIVLCCPKTPQ